MNYRSRIDASGKKKLNIKLEHRKPETKWVKTKAPTSAKSINERKEQNI